MKDERKAAVESTVDFVVGRVVEIGDIECLGNKPGLVIETTMEQLRAHGRNLAFCDVEIRLKANNRVGRRQCVRRTGGDGVQRRFGRVRLRSDFEPLATPRPEVKMPLDKPGTAG